MKWCWLAVFNVGSFKTHFPLQRDLDLYYNYNPTCSTGCHSVLVIRNCISLASAVIRIYKTFLNVTTAF